MLEIQSKGCPVFLGSETWPASAEQALRSGRLMVRPQKLRWMELEDHLCHFNRMFSLFSVNAVIGDGVYIWGESKLLKYSVEASKEASLILCA